MIHSRHVRTGFLLIASISCWLLFASCRDADTTAPTSNGGPVVTLQQITGIWIHIATAIAPNNGATTTNLLETFEYLTIASDRCTFSTGSYNDYYPIGKTRWLYNNLFIFNFSNYYPSFSHSDSMYMSVQLTGNVMRTEWTPIGQSTNTKYADLWIRSNALDQIILGVTRSSNYSALSNRSIYNFSSGYNDSVATSDQYGFFSIQTLQSYPDVGIINGSSRRHGVYRSISSINSCRLIDIAINTGSIVGTISPVYSKFGRSVTISTIPKTDSITLSRNETQSGNYQLLNIPSGSFEVVVSGFGFETNRQAVTLPDNQTDTVNFTMRPSPYGALKIVATDSLSGNGIHLQNVDMHFAIGSNYVSLYNTDSIAYVDSIPSGTLQINAYTSGYNSKTYSATILAGDTTTLNVILNHSYCRLTGVLNDELTDQPVASARVVLLGTSDSTDTDSDGNFQFDRVETGERFLRVEKAGYVTDSILINCYGNGTYHITATINPLICFDRAALQGHSDQVNCVAFNRQSTMLASGSDDNRILIWSTSTHALLQTIASDAYEVTCLSFTADGNFLAAGTWNGSVKLWRVSDGALIRTFPQQPSRITDLAIDPTDTRLAVVAYTSDSLKFYRLADGTLDRAVHSESNLHSVQFNPSGTRVICTSNTTVPIFRVDDGSNYYTFSDLYPIAATYSTSGTKLAIASNTDHRIKIYRSIDLTSLNTISLSSNQLLAYKALTFHPNGKVIGAISEGSLLFWECSDNSALYQTVESGSNGLTSLAISPDGGYVAAGGSDNSVWIWKSHGE